MKCPEQALLSPYLDGEISSFDTHRLAKHMQSCAQCRRSLQLLGALKAKLSSIPAPEIPEDLAAELDRMVIASLPVDVTRKSSASGAISWRAYAWGICAATFMTCVVWWKVSEQKPSEIPLEWLLAQHKHYAAALPLAQAERVIPQEPIAYSHGF